jgi:hypothetical protein
MDKLLVTGASGLLGSLVCVRRGQSALAQFEREILHWAQSNYLRKFKLHKSI